MVFKLPKVGGLLLNHCQGCHFTRKKQFFTFSCKKRKLHFHNRKKRKKPNIRK